MRTRVGLSCSTVLFTDMLLVRCSLVDVVGPPDRIPTRLVDLVDAAIPPPPSRRAHPRLPGMLTPALPGMLTSALPGMLTPALPGVLTPAFPACLWPGSNPP
ncbi:hypothetical protein GCM10027089_10320 [Nocardia thraciensis]